MPREDWRNERWREEASALWQLGAVSWLGPCGTNQCRQPGEATPGVGAFRCRGEVSRTVSAVSLEKLALPLDLLRLLLANMSANSGCLLVGTRFLWYVETWLAAFSIHDVQIPAGGGVVLFIRRCETD